MREFFSSHFFFVESLFCVKKKKKNFFGMQFLKILLDLRNFFFAKKKVGLFGQEDGSKGRDQPHQTTQKKKKKKKKKSRWWWLYNFCPPPSSSPFVFCAEEKRERIPTPATQKV